MSLNMQRLLFRRLQGWRVCFGGRAAEHMTQRFEHNHWLEEGCRRYEQIRHLEKAAGDIGIVGHD